MKTELKTVLQNVTPLPWEIGEMWYPKDGERGSVELRQDMGVLATFHLPAKPHIGYSQGPANARYALHAANVLPELVEALRDMCEKVKDVEDEHAHLGVKRSDRLKKALATLTKAETIEV